MDGIFGVGLGEMVIIGLVLFIIVGPENTARWARALGRLVRQARQEWARLAAELHDELGEEGREALEAMREVGREFRQARTLPQQVIREALTPEPPPHDPPEPPQDAQTPTYPAWLPPKDPPNA